MREPTNFLRSTNAVIVPVILATSIIATRPPSEPNMTLIAEVDGKAFYALRNPVMNWIDAYDYCWSQGMKLASVTTLAQYKALNDSYSEDTFSGDYWTSGRNANLRRQFSWNPSREQPGDFIPYYTIGYPKPITCLVLSSQTTESDFYSELCTSLLGVICETK